MSVEFVRGERYIVQSGDGKSFIGTFHGMTGSNLVFKSVVLFVDLKTDDSTTVDAATLLDAEPYRQRIVPADVSRVSTARAIASGLSKQDRVVVPRMAARRVK